MYRDMTTKELINQYVTAHADNRWMDASELEALLTEFAEKLKEPSSEDLEQAAEQAEQREGNLINGRFKAGFKSGAQWQKEQMMKDAVNAVVVKPDYQARGVTKSIRLQIDDDSIACAYDKGEKVKVIIIKD